MFEIIIDTEKEEIVSITQYEPYEDENKIKIPVEQVPQVIAWLQEAIQEIERDAKKESE
jgi:hypothetical protein